MHRYNARIYNYSNLMPEDKNILRALAEIYLSVNNSQNNYESNEYTTYLEKIFNETAVEVVKEISQLIDSEMIEFIVSRIDAYDDSVKLEEYDTDDYFYGLK